MRYPRNRRLACATLGCAVLALAGCTGATAQQNDEALPRASLHEMQPPETPEGPGEPERQAIMPPDEAALTLVQLNIDPAVHENCGPVDFPTPMFRFDSAKPTAEASRSIRRLGECLAEGPLQAAEVVLIGHADPWGDGDYNRRLAERRAKRVGALLQAEGVASARIAIESRGERAATARPDHWPVERRVDIAVKL